jgi:Uma2 family endonuclease
MTTAAASTALPAAAAGPQTLSLPDDSRVLLQGIRWQTYEALLADLGSSQIRLTYDRGSLEIMAPLYRHERYVYALARLVEILAEELDVDFIAAGSTTLRREIKQRGLEPDRCFYIQHVAEMAGKMELDLTTDPPPDLAIEVNNTHSSLDRMGIYGSLGVPEVWRYDGDRLLVYRRKRNSTYKLVTTSPTFPTLPVAEVLPLLDQLPPLTGRQMIRTIRDWVRANALPKS